MANPAPIATVVLPDAQGQACGRKLHNPNHGLGVGMCVLALWLGVWGLAQFQPVASAPMPPPAPTLAVYQASSAPRLLVALHMPAHTRAGKATPTNHDTLAEASVLAGHVVKTLLQDQFDSIILKVSLGRQVAEHLRAGAFR